MALSKLQATSLDFGTMEHLSSTTVATPAQFIIFDNLSTDYDTFHCQFELHPETDSRQLGCQFLDSSGTAITDVDAYGYYNDLDGSALGADNANSMPFTAATLGNDTHEGVRGWFNLQGRNYAVATDTVPPCILGIAQGHYISNVYSGGAFVGGLNTEQVQTIRGFRLYVSAGNIERGKVHLYGMRST